MKTLKQTQDSWASSGSKSPHQTLKTLKVCLSLAVMAAWAPSMHAATTITTEPSSLGTLFPAVADVIAATGSESSLFDSGLKAGELSLSQTVQSLGFDLKTIYIQYNDVDGHTIDLSIFPVADVNAASHAEPPTGVILSETITLPATTSRTVAAIELDVPITLAANAGTDGYAVHITTATLDNSMKWTRTTSNSGSVYAGGIAYEDGLSKNDGLRDFVLALDSLPVPEPSTAALLGFGFLFLLGRVRSSRTG